MSSVDPFYTRQFRRADEDVVQRFREHEADDATPEMADDTGWMYAGIALVCAVASGVLACLFLIVMFFKEIL